MIRAVLFDLDGTLIDSTDAIVGSTQYTFEVMGQPVPTRAQILAGIGHPLPQSLAQLGMPDVAAAIPVYRDRYAEMANANTTLLPGVRETVEAFAAAGLHQAVVTSKRREAALPLLEYLCIGAHFALCIGPEEVRNAKPDPEGVLLAMETFAVAPEETVFVGDMYFDVEAAHRAGVACLAVATGYETRASLEALKPAAVYDHMDGVRAYVLDRVAATTA
jgi:phosphoglycolate phosphatase